MPKLDTLEQKFSNSTTANINFEGHRIKGYASIFSVVDSHNDDINKGSFQESIARHKAEGKVKFLWQHNHEEPIGVIEELYEDDIGLAIVGSINKNTQRGREVIALINQGAVSGLSIGFKVEDFFYKENGVRNIKKVNLWEISIVTFPANKQAQINSKSQQLIDDAAREVLLAILETVSKLNQSI